MSTKPTLTITIAGQTGTGRTTLAEEFRCFLKSKGFQDIEVKEEIDEHLPSYYTTEKQTARIGNLIAKGTKITIQTKQTPRHRTTTARVNP